LLLQVDPPPKTKVKPTLTSNLVTGKFIVWNILGKVKSCVSSSGELLQAVLT
jgi:hypothetical protein